VYLYLSSIVISYRSYLISFGCRQRFVAMSAGQRAHYFGLTAVLTAAREFEGTVARFGVMMADFSGNGLADILLGFGGSGIVYLYQSGR
jgi:hypothetical protein